MGSLGVESFVDGIHVGGVRVLLDALLVSTAKHTYGKENGADMVSVRAIAHQIYFSSVV